MPANWMEYLHHIQQHCMALGRCRHVVCLFTGTRTPTSQSRRRPRLLSPVYEGAIRYVDIGAEPRVVLRYACAIVQTREDETAD